MDIALYVIGSLIAVLALGMGALVVALVLALVIRFLEDREQDRLAKQKTIPPPPWPGHKLPPIPPDHARVMARPPMFTPEPAVTPEVPLIREEQDASEQPTDGNNDRPRGKWDDDPTEDGPNLTLISELTNPPTPVRSMEAPKTTPRRSMFRNLFRRDKPR
ncbi:MAG: hypothetical protein QG626_511 [Patescibacteria group bacterium]|jgi:hypothetical protein|nr:hypothetical protein [Patescibacteria group bacterium]